jgi:hypothetical protein
VCRTEIDESPVRASTYKMQISWSLLPKRGGDERVKAMPTMLRGPPRS